MKLPGALQSILSSPHIPSAAAGLASSAVRSILLLSIGLVLLLAMFGAANATYVPWSLGSLRVHGVAILLTLAILLAVLHLATRARPVRPATFLLASVLAGIALHLGYGLPLDLEYISDFQSYWRGAATLADQDNLDALNDIYKQRAIPFLWPLVEIFGQSRVALLCMNALMLGVVQLTGYDLLRRAISHQAAQAFSVLWIFAPEPLLASAIPSHDVTGTAMFAVALWLNAVVFTGNGSTAPQLRWVLISGLALGMALYLLDMARGTGTGVLMLASAVGILLVLLINRWKAAPSSTQPDNRPPMLALQLLSAAVVFSILIAVANAAGLRMDSRMQEARNLRAYTPHQTALSDGSYQFVMRFHNAFNRDLMKEPERFGSQALTIARSEFLERPVARIWSSLNRAVRLSNLGTQRHFYLARSDEQPRWLISLAPLYNSYYVLMLSALALYGLAQLLRAPLKSPVLLQQSALLAAMILALVAMREAQPRYIFLTWMVAASLAGAGLSLPGFASRQIARSVLTGLGHMAAAVAMASGLAFIAWAALKIGYAPDNGRVLTRWTLHGSDETHYPGRLAREQSAPTDVLSTDVNGKPLARHTPYMVDFDDLSLKLAFFGVTKPGQQAAASKQVCTDNDAPLSLTFQYYTPYKRLEQKGAFTLSLLADGKPVWSAALPQATRPVRATTPPVLERTGACVDLRFQLESNRKLSRESWIRASKVEVFYPHLVPTPHRALAETR